MAKLFRLYDYEKEGPGVEKNERKKKGFFAFFEIYFRNFWSFFRMGPIYWVVCLPLVTNGLAAVGMTHIARSTTREKHSFLMSDFLETVKKNWKQALPLGIINLVVSVLAVVDVWYFWSYLTASKEMTAFGVIGLGVAFFLLISVIIMKYYIWTLTITFSLPLSKLIKNSFHFVFLNLPRNLMIAVIMGIIYAGLYILAVINPFCFILALVLLVCVVPGFKASLVQANTFPVIQKHMIDPYYAEHKGEDIEKRRALGLDIPEDELPEAEQNEETVFTDHASRSEEE